MAKKNTESSAISKPQKIEIVKSYSGKPEIRKTLWGTSLIDFIVDKQIDLLPNKIINAILKAIKTDQQSLIQEKDSFNSNNQQLSFDDLFDNFSEDKRVKLTFKFEHLRINQNIRNSQLKDALISLSNLHWSLEEDLEGSVELIPFIEKIKWNKNSRFIEFQMHRKTMELLLDMDHYINFNSDVLIALKSNHTLRFMMWMHQKYIKIGFVEKSYQYLCEYFGITRPWKNDINDFFKRIKIEINESQHHYGMNYTIKEKEQKVAFRFFPKKEGVGLIDNIQTSESLKILNCMVYLVKRRKLDDHYKALVEAKYHALGYDILSKIVNRKIPLNLMNEEYYNKMIELINNEHN